MKRKGKGSSAGKETAITVMLAAPILTLGVTLLCAKMMLSGSIREEQLSTVCGAIVGIVSFVLCLFVAVRMPQKKFLWGMLTALGYACALLLGNLLFFGVGYGGFAMVLLPLFVAGILGSLLGTKRHGKYA